MPTTSSISGTRLGEQLAALATAKNQDSEIFGCGHLCLLFVLTQRAAVHQGPNARDGAGASNQRLPPERTTGAGIVPPAVTFASIVMSAGPDLVQGRATHRAREGDPRDILLQQIERHSQQDHVFH